jgi:CDGSH-type Zn-finger protein
LNELKRRLLASATRVLAQASVIVDGEMGSPDPGGQDADESFWTLALKVTALRAQDDDLSSIDEAVAALQLLSSTLSDSAAMVPARIQRLREIQKGSAARIRPQHNGPYIVTNAATLTDWLGQELSVPPTAALCRCGGSTIKPFCDGTHVQNRFDDRKDPRRVPDRQDTYVGQQITVLDNRGTCAHSGLCTDRLSTVFHLGKEPFVTPSGARLDDAGLPVARNVGASLEHYSLCRCGHSQNKPFCSGMHWHVRFVDPVFDANHQWTLFDWAGGLPALTRMTRLFYSKYVPDDPLIGPLLANMSPDHPERVATWLSEVFGGPKNYSDRYGGYSRMVSQHMGKEITETQRARWVALLCRCADEAGLPRDPEWRAAFVAYLEWGSRLALENSQPGAKPPANMPVPRWWWVCDATPGSRVSALAPAPVEPQARLPGPAERVTFEAHIRPLFRLTDRQSMRFAFDLWAHADVVRHAAEILHRVENGSMPCDGPWPKERVDVFRRWVESGAPP